MNSDSDGIKNVLERYAACCNSGDIESWMSLWSTDGRQMPPDAPARIGVEAIREAMEPIFSNMNMKLELASIDEARVFGDLGLTRCNYSLIAYPKEGGDSIAVMPDGKALTLYVRQDDGTWKIVYDCFNSNTA